MGMIPSNPTIIPVPFANNGQKNIIPQNAGTVGSANASWDQGFPGVTMIAKQAGGKPPLGKDFNGVLNQLSSNAFFAQSGCIYAWSNSLNYLAGSHVQGTDGHEYIALMPSGPDIPASGGGYIGAQNPISSTSYWIDLTAAILTASGGSAGYEVCTVVYNNFIGPSSVSGMVPVTGTLVANASVNYPDAWAFLQTSSGQALCCSEADWQAASTAVYYTAADGTQYSWNGVGGVCKYVIDTNAGTIRVPDLRGMFPMIAPFDSVNVGDVRADAMRNIAGSFNGGRSIRRPTAGDSSAPSGPWISNSAQRVNTLETTGLAITGFDASRIVPTGDYTAPRRYGTNGFVYLGKPAA